MSEDFYGNIDQIHTLVSNKFESSAGLFSQFLSDAKTVLASLQNLTITADYLTNVPKIDPKSVPSSLDFLAIQRPRLKELQIPEIPNPPQIKFPNVDIPNLFNLNLYNSILERIIDTLKNGGTGLGGPVEDSIYNRAIERELLELNTAEERVISMWASRGFELPSDMISEKLNEIREKFYYQRLQTSREIMIKQAEIAFENYKLCMQVGLEICKVALSLLEILPRLIIEEGKLTIEAYQSYLSGIKSKLDVQATYNDSLLKEYTSTIQAEATKSQVKMEETKVKIAEIENFVKNFYINAQLEMERGKFNLTQALEKSKINIEAQKAVATLYSNISSALLQSMNTLIQLSANYHASGPIEAPS